MYKGFGIKYMLISFFQCPTAIKREKALQFMKELEKPGRKKWQLIKQDKAFERTLNRKEKLNKTDD